MSSTVAGAVKIKIPDTLARCLDDPSAAAAPNVSPVLTIGSEASSKYCPEISCLMAKRLNAGHQRNRECKAAGQRKRELRTLLAVKREQSRRTAYENHVVSKTIANYAKNHCPAVRLEDLAGASSRSIRRLTQSSNRACSQLLSFLQNTCALPGLPLLEVCAAYAIKQCSRCATIRGPSGKHCGCPTCRHDDHPDLDAPFDIAARSWPLGSVPSGGGGDGPSAPSAGCIDQAQGDAHATA